MNKYVLLNLILWVCLIAVRLQFSPPLSSPSFFFNDNSIKNIVQFSFHFAELLPNFLNRKTKSP